VAKLKEFSLALGVINNILICDRNHRILFAGDEISKRLFKSRENTNQSLLDNFSDPEEREGLKEKIAEVWKNKNTCYFRFKKRKKNLFLFPANYKDSESIILAAEEQILAANNIETALKERVKELECVYNISNELESTKNLYEALENSTAYLAKGFRYPQFTRVNYHLDGDIYGDKEYCPEKSKNSDCNLLSEDILINEKVRGKIEVCYTQWADFLEEERKLLREVSLMVSRKIEKKETRKNLLDQRELQVSKNKELTKLTENLTKSNNNLQAFLNAITDTIVVIDKDFNITRSNDEAVGTSGKCYKKIFNSDSICENCPAMMAFREARPVSLEKKKNGQYFTLQAYPILNSKGSVDTVLEICSDITEEEQIKTQLIQSYKLASLGKLVAGVAHEINNPNTFIRGNVKIIAEAFTDILPLLDRFFEENENLKIARLDYKVFRENIPVLLEDMMGGANRIKKIVDGLRNFARKDEGLLTDDVDINYLIQNNLRITEKQVRKHAKLKLNLAPSLPKFKGNIQKLEQVLMNMLTNASQAIEKDDGVIFIETGMDKTGNEIFIKISDNGKGMDEKTKRHIFDPFFTTKRHKGGTGLGLSISYGIINEHKGNITVDSQLGSGTTFTIKIPAVATEQ